MQQYKSKFSEAKYFDRKETSSLLPKIKKIIKDKTSKDFEKLGIRLTIDDFDFESSDGTVSGSFRIKKTRD